MEYNYVLGGAIDQWTNLYNSESLPESCTDSLFNYL